MAKKAIVLVSGGLHSTAALAVAASRNYEIYAITFDFGQKNRVKLEAAKAMAKKFGAKDHQVVKFDLPYLPENHPGVEEGYAEIPARNNIYLSFALSWAELVQAANIFIGVNSIEYGDNPDCRPSFIHSFEKYANLAIKKGSIRKLDIWSPLMNASTAETIARGEELGINWAETYSCRDLDEEGRACGECIHCEYRLEGFKEAGMTDPAVYRS